MALRRRRHWARAGPATTADETNHRDDKLRLRPLAGSLGRHFHPGQVFGWPAAAPTRRLHKWPPTGMIRLTPRTSTGQGNQPVSCGNCCWRGIRSVLAAFPRATTNRPPDQPAPAPTASRRPAERDRDVAGRSGSARHGAAARRHRPGSTIGGGPGVLVAPQGRT